MLSSKRRAEREEGGDVWLGVEFPLAEAGVEVPFEVTWSDGWKLISVPRLGWVGGHIFRKPTSVESMRMLGPILFGPNAQIL